MRLGLEMLVGLAVGGRGCTCVEVELHVSILFANGAIVVRPAFDSVRC